MNLLYKNLYGTSTYPFISAIPFPAFCISHIKLAIKKALDTPFVSTVAYKNGRLFILLRTDSRYLCSFLIEDSMYKTVDNELVFGFIRIAKMPSQEFYFNGKWILARDCYTYSIPLRGLQKAYVLNNVILQGDLLLQFTGDFSTRLSSDSCVVNIGRLLGSAHLDYTLSGGIKLKTEDSIGTYMTSVNNYSVKDVTIVSDDPTISVLGPLYVGGNVWVLYINSLLGFPSCTLESDSNANL